MITVLMLYATLVAALIAAATVLAERGARALRWPARWLWMAALAGSLLAPAVAVWMRGDAEVPLERTMVASLADAGIDPTGPASNVSQDRRQPTLIERVSARGMALAGVLDAPLVAVWALGSLAILGFIVLAAARLHRARREWPTALVDDHFVRISEDTGPAVVGFARSEIVLPEWAITLTPGRRAMLLAHEREHIRARDPVLLYAGLAALVLAPWNAALWWQLRRLRLAVEMDCDARVLRACPDVRAYGALLIEVGRRTVRAPLAAAAFSEPATHLERRIHMMLARPPRLRVLRAVMLGIAGLVLAFVACDLQAPVGPTPQDQIAYEELEKSYNVKDGVDGNRLHAAISEFFPELLRESGDTVWTVTFVQDHTGRIVQASRQPHSRERFEAAQVEERRLLEELRVMPTRTALRADEIEVRSGTGKVALRGATATISGELRLDGDSVRALSGVLRRPISELTIEERREIERAAQERQQTLARARLTLPRDRSQNEGNIVMREVPVRRPIGPRVPASQFRGENLFEKLDPDLIQSVEIIKGGALPFAPGAGGGVIWIQLKQRISF